MTLDIVQSWVDQWIRPLARSTDPRTSHAAEQSLDPSDMERLVLDTLRKFTLGATSHRIEQQLQLPHESVSPRIRPLVRKGLVRDSGRTEPGPSGRQRIVWEAVPPLTTWQG